MRHTPGSLLRGMLLCVTAWALPGVAQESPPGESRTGFIAAPFVIYSPETSWIFGLGAAGYFQNSADSTRKPSTYGTSVQYSVNGQYVFDPDVHLYFDEGRTLVETRLRFLRTFEAYYGVGNDAPALDEPYYEMRRIQVRVEFLRQWGPLMIGPLAEFADETLRDARENPFLLAMSAPGQEVSRAVGAGISLLHDGRNRVYAPSHGTLARLRCVGYPELLGSESEFAWIEADLRHYLSLGDELVLAFQLFGETTEGDVPFFRLPALGGQERMRGILFGRYRDRTSLVAQTEFRATLFWRIGAALFASVGEVAPSPGRISLQGLRHAAGIGVRYTMDEEEQLKIRVDYGFAPGTNGIYLTVDEAF